jgi:hypothetical protein
MPAASQLRLPPSPALAASAREREREGEREAGGGEREERERDRGGSEEAYVRTGVRRKRGVPELGKRRQIRESFANIIVTPTIPSIRFPARAPAFAATAFTLASNSLSPPVRA